MPYPMPTLKFSDAYVDYETACAFMEKHIRDIYQGDAPECLWFLEHPPIYTAGISAQPEDLCDPTRFPVYQSGRGGQYTYHGPGQRVIYLMLDLNKRGRDIRHFITQIERWIIVSLKDFGIDGFIRPERVGVWVKHPSSKAREDKIAAIGIRMRRWVSFHGVSINLDPDLEHFSGIIPCGITEHGVTSMAALGHTASMAELDQSLIRNFERFFCG